MKGNNVKKTTDSFFNNLAREIAIWQELDNRNIVKFYDFSQTPNNYYFIMEFCPDKDLA